VDDVVNGTLKVIDNKESYNQIYNLTYGESHTIESLAAKIIKLTNSKSKINKIKTENIYPKRGSLNIDKIKKLGYAPENNLDHGLKKIYELFWSRQNI
jgi:nucleoside-diphosphate-sugar epimerase